MTLREVLQKMREQMIEEFAWRDRHNKHPLGLANYYGTGPRVVYGNTNAKKSDRIAKLRIG